MKPSENAETREAFDPRHFESLIRVEDHHFWFRARNNVIRRVLRDVGPHLIPDDLVVEFGCGTGNTLRVLREVFPTAHVVGTDLILEGLTEARRRTSAWLVASDVSASPFRRDIRIACMFDVLEHLADDVGALRAVHDQLAPDGRLVLTVPASPALWSDFDVAAMHQRRYERASLRLALERAGYRVERLSSFMLSVWPLMWLRRRARARFRTGPAELAEADLRVVSVVNALLYAVLRLEGVLTARGRRLRSGTSLLAVARKA